MSIKKRGQNEGSIYFHNKSNSWCAQISLEGKRITKYFKTKTEARAWIKETLDKLLILIEKSDVKIDDLDIKKVSLKRVFEHFTKKW